MILAKLSYFPRIRLPFLSTSIDIFQWCISDPLQFGELKHRHSQDFGLPWQWEGTSGNAVQEVSLGRQRSIGSRWFRQVRVALLHPNAQTFVHCGQPNAINIHKPSILVMVHSTPLEKWWWFGKISGEALEVTWWSQRTKPWSRLATMCHDVPRWEAMAGSHGTMGWVIEHPHDLHDSDWVDGNYRIFWLYVHEFFIIPMDDFWYTEIYPLKTYSNDYILMGIKMGWSLPFLFICLISLEVGLPTRGAQAPSQVYFGACWKGLERDR